MGLTPHGHSNGEKQAREAEEMVRVHVSWGRERRRKERAGLQRRGHGRTQITAAKLPSAQLFSANTQSRLSLQGSRNLLCDPPSCQNCSRPGLRGMSVLTVEGSKSGCPSTGPKPHPLASLSQHCPVVWSFPLAFPSPAFTGRKQAPC